MVEESSLSEVMSIIRSSDDFSFCAESVSWKASFSLSVFRCSVSIFLSSFSRPGDLGGMYLLVGVEASFPVVMGGYVLLYSVWYCWLFRWIGEEFGHSFIMCPGKKQRRHIWGAGQLLVQCPLSLQFRHTGPKDSPGFVT